MTAERTWEELEQAAEREYGEAWLPHKNPDHPRTLIGVVRRYDEGPVSDYTGEPQWIATVEDRAGKDWSVWLNTAVLLSEFKAKRPMPGEQIAIAYKGIAERASRTGMSPPHLYRVVVKRDTQLPFTQAAGGLPATAEPDVPIDVSGLPEPPPVDAEIIPDDEPPPF